MDDAESSTGCLHGVEVLAELLRLKGVTPPAGFQPLSEDGGDKKDKDDNEHDFSQEDRDDDAGSRGSMNDSDSGSWAPDHTPRSESSRSDDVKSEDDHKRVDNDAGGGGFASLLDELERIEGDAEAEAKQGDNADDAKYKAVCLHVSIHMYVCTHTCTYM